jgi:hypothetical protein
MTEALPNSASRTRVGQTMDVPMKHAGEKQNIALAKKMLPIPD